MNRFCRLKRKRTTFKAPVNTLFYVFFHQEVQAEIDQNFKNILRTHPDWESVKNGFILLNFFRSEYTNIYMPLTDARNTNMSADNSRAMHRFWSLKKMTMAVNMLIKCRPWGRVSREMMKFNQHWCDSFRFTASLMVYFFSFCDFLLLRVVLYDL